MIVYAWNKVLTVLLIVLTTTGTNLMSVLRIVGGEAQTHNKQPG